jgi:hypothetical protein
MWFGLLGAGFSWMFMFLFGYGLSVGTCNPFIADRGIPFDTWTIIDTALGAALAILSIVAAVITFLATREGTRTGDELAGKGGPPPGGRIHFLSIIGMLVSPLFLFIILLAGLGSFVLSTCTQA